MPTPSVARIARAARVLVAAVTFGTILPGAAGDEIRSAAPASSSVQRAEVGGLAVEFSVVPGQGGSPEARETFQARLRFSDAATGAPSRGIRPAAWMQLRRSPVALETGCEDRAKQFAAGSLGSRADIDLNAYRLVTMNQDATIAFINPHVRIRNSRLEAIVTLPGRGHDWVHAAGSRRIAVTLRNEGQLAIVDTVEHHLAGLVDLGESSEPTRLVVEADGRHVWVGLDGRDEIVRVDLLERRVVSRVTTARGPHLLTLLPERGLLAVAHAGADQVTLVDTRSATVIGSVAVDAGPIAIAWSEAAQRLVVLAGRAGALHLLEVTPGGPRAGAVIATEPGALVMTMLDGGRHVLVGNVTRHELSLVDLAQTRRVDRIGIAPWPDQIVTAGRFAYVRSQTTNQVTLVDLAQARAGRLVPVAVTIGRGTPGDEPQALNVAPMMVAAPEGHGIYAAVASDRQLYRYSEGLMVPSGSLGNYRRVARSLMVLDDSLQEREAGVFEAPVRADRPGRYDVVIRNATPAATVCLSVAIDAAATPDGSATPPAPVRPRLAAWHRTGDRLDVSVALGVSPPSASSTSSTPSAADASLAGGDLTLLALVPGSGWQRRIVMTPAMPGRWSASLQLPARVPTDRIELLVASDQHGIPFTRGRIGPLGRPATALPTEVADGRR